MAALKVSSLDLMRGSIEVSASYSEVGGELVLGATKTYRRRSVLMPCFLCVELAEYLAHEGIAADPDEHVFRAPSRGDGAQRYPLRQANFYPRTFKPALRKAGLDGRLRFHDLRHTCAALMIAQGAHPQMIMDRLGRSSVTVSLDRYGHLLPSPDEALVDGLDQIRGAATASQELVPVVLRG